MNKITVDLSDEAIADLHTAQFKLSALWKDSPGLEDYEVTESDAVRMALLALVTGSWDIHDLVPPEPQGR